LTEEDLPLNVPDPSYQLATTAPGTPLTPVTGGIKREIGGGGGMLARQSVKDTLINLLYITAIITHGTIVS
jgi:hypothetical protein